MRRCYPLLQGAIQLQLNNETTTRVTRPAINVFCTKKPREDSGLSYSRKRLEMYKDWNNREQEDLEMDSMRADNRKARKDSKVKLVLNMNKDTAETLFNLLAGNMDSLSDYENYVRWLEPVTSQIRQQVPGIGEE